MSDGEDAIDAQFWDSFPLDEVPRPVVLVDDRVHISAAGFGHDGEAKRAWLDGAIETRVDLPVGLMQLLAPGRRVHDGPPILITQCSRASASFVTDRGPRDLPAFRVTATGLIDPCLVLDPAVSCWWPPRGQLDAPRSGSATIADDDRTIEFTAMGGVLTEFHGARFEEDRTFVIAYAITTRKEVPPGTAVAAVGVGRRVTGRLNKPLGARVLLTAWGAPMTVVPTGRNV